MRKIIYIILAMMVLTACTKEIDFDFHEVEPMVVIEGRVTNEGTSVVVAQTRSVTDSVRSHCLPGAVVTITTDDTTATLPYNDASDSYRSSLTGVAGKTYQLSVDFEGHHYEATSYMPASAPILSTDFFWMSMMDERMLVYELWAVDPDPSERSHYWYRIDRVSHHPHFDNKTSIGPYHWGVLDDRGCPPGKVFIDMICASEKEMDKDEEEDWKYILYDGDTITCQLMTIAPTIYDYFRALRAGQSGGANPHSNITGGCLGYFQAGSITHTDTIVFNRNNVQEWKKEN